MTTLASIVGRGVVASRPAAGIAGQLYFATDVSGGTLQRDNGSTWDSVESGAYPTLTTASSALAADVTITLANTYYDGPTITVAAGTWLLTGTAQGNSTGQNRITVRLWDGTTSLSSGETVMGGAGFATSITPPSVIVTPGGSTTYRLAMAQDSTGGKMLAACPENGVGNNASRISAIRIG